MCQVCENNPSSGAQLCSAAKEPCEGFHFPAGDSSQKIPREHRNLFGAAGSGAGPQVAGWSFLLIVFVTQVTGCKCRPFSVTHCHMC